MTTQLARLRDDAYSTSGILAVVILVGKLRRFTLNNWDSFLTGAGCEGVQDKITAGYEGGQDMTASGYEGGQIMTALGYEGGQKRTACGYEGGQNITASGYEVGQDKTASGYEGWTGYECFGT